MKSEIKRLLLAAKNSIVGWRYLITTEPNIRYLLLLLLLTLALGLSRVISLIQLAILVTALALVVGLEIANTIIETLLDSQTTRYSPAVRKIKDMGSAAVFFGLIIYGLILLVMLVFG